MRWGEMVWHAMGPHQELSAAVCLLDRWRFASGVKYRPEVPRPAIDLRALGGALGRDIHRTRMGWGSWGHVVNASG